MPEDPTLVDKTKFDALLQKMIKSKPVSKKEISAKIKAKRKAKRVRKLDR